MCGEEQHASTARVTLLWKLKDAVSAAQLREACQHLVTVVLVVSR